MALLLVSSPIGVSEAQAPEAIYSSEPILEKPVEPDCSCVVYARQISSFQPPRVKYAKDILITSQTPIIGSWVVFNYPPFGHTEIVIGIGSGVIRTEGFNLEPCKVIKRVISVDDPAIRGYFSE